MDLAKKLDTLNSDIKKAQDRQDFLINCDYSCSADKEINSLSKYIAEKKQELIKLKNKIAFG